MSTKKELEITNKDIELLKEMKKNCLKSNVYEDDKRLLKSNAITKFLMLYEENEQLKARLELFENGVYFSRENDRLEEENDKLKEQLEKYENPEDMTLMMMWATEKVKDENKELKKQQQEFIKYLEDEIEKLKNEIFVNSLTGDDLDLYIMRVKFFKLNEILQKCLEIIGGNKDE